MFQPQIIDNDYFEKNGINVRLSENLNRQVREISSKFASGYEAVGGLQNSLVEFVKVPFDTPLPKHGDSPNCPVNILELNPAYDACDIGCQYCQTTDGCHLNTIKVIKNFPEYYANILENNDGADIIYYASPQTEIFQKPLMDSGVTMGIFSAFKKHLEENPKSEAKMFVVTKIDITELGGLRKAKEVAQMLASLQPALRLSGSVGMMPDDLRAIIEPKAKDFESRMDFIRLCQKEGLDIKSVLFQPIIDTLADEEILNKYLKMLSGMGIEHMKPEFLTISLENTIYFAQLVGSYDKNLEKAIWENRLAVDEDKISKKIRRIPPQNREYIRDKYLQIKRIAKTYGIETTLCSWTRKNYELPEYNLESLSRGRGCMGQWPASNS